MSLRVFPFIVCVFFWGTLAISPKAKAAVDPIADSVTGWFAFPYRLFIPDSASEMNPLPLIVFLHGSGEQGADNQAQVQAHIQPLMELAKGNDYPSYLVAPQASAGWGGDDAGPLILELIKYLGDQHFIDRRRVYITGLSNGGLGTWRALAAAGDQVAAGIPLSSDAFPAGIDSITAPVWAFHGDMDTSTPVNDTRQMITGLKAAGQLPRYTERAGGRHNGWSNIYADSSSWTGSYDCGDPTDTSAGLIAWMFAQQSPPIAENLPRAVSAGDVFLFDFGDLSITPSPDPNQRHWNLIRDEQLPAGVERAELMTQSGEKTFASLYTSAKFLRSNNAGLDAFHYYPKSAEKDNFNVGSGAGHSAALLNSAILELRNLPANSPCRITFFGSRRGDDSGRGYLTRFQVSNQWKDLEAANNANQAVSLGSVLSDGDGKISLNIGVSPEGMSRYGILSTIEVEVDPVLKNFQTIYTESEVTYQFPTRKNWLYQIQSSDNLSVWQNLPGFNVVGSGFLMELTTPSLAESSMFYRVSEKVN